MRTVLACAAALTSVTVGVAALVTARAQPDDASPIYGVRLPEGYRDWKLVSVAQENGANNDIRAILGNEIALKAFRDGTRPFPDGAVIARLAWRYEPSPRNDAVFPAPQSFVAGAPTNVQISIKDSKRYADTGGWGYGQFDAGVANKNVSLTQSCFACHTKLRDLSPGSDLVFTPYSH
ncbi:cytochrome P460 family protein [Methylobacterium trifolii]|nr:cytochrome P460 family protein [Methylobacterium trifolii]